MPKRSIKYGIGYVRSRGKYLYGEYYHRGQKFRKAVHSLDEGRAWLGSQQAQLLQIGYRLSEEEIARIGAAMKRLPEHVGISELVDYWLAHHPGGGDSLTVSECVQRLISDREKAGLRPRSIDAIRIFLGRFERDCGDNSIGSISTKELDDWLAGIGVAGLNRRNYIAYLKQLFNFGVRMGYCPTNPASKLGSPIITPSQCGILTVKQAQSLVDTARRFKCVRFFAIGLFQGARSSELHRIDEADVRPMDRITAIMPDVSKKRRKRFINMPENLFEIITTCGEIGSIDISRKRFERIIKEAGISDWPQNAMRHSFASYHLAYHQDAAKTAYELGHVSPALVYDHYRLLVTKEEAAKYWQIK